LCNQIAAGRKLGIQEMEDRIRLVSFMACDLGGTEAEKRTLQTIDDR
jgi:hypothetical protein